MSVCTTGTCPHERGVFIWLGDGPWLGDPADPDYDCYPWVHDTSGEDDRGRLTVCELMPFATAEEAGEVCACAHSSRSHVLGAAGALARLRPCDCGCPDFRHWAEGRTMWSCRLSCGCDFLTHYVPKPGVGAYVSCANSLKHQSSYRIETIAPVTVDAARLRDAVQMTLFGPVRKAVKTT